MSMRSVSRRTRALGAFFCFVIGALSTLGGGGCARRRAELTTYAAPVPEDGVVFVADGAGDYQNFSRALRTAGRGGGFSVQVVTFEWSHGYLRSIADQIHYSYARRQGRELAEEVLAYRREHPGRPVHLAGHSAGALVVMTALECLPPQSVDRVIFVSPSLSAFYDLGPGLRAVKGGLHNFYSRRDWFYGELVTRVLGNSDRNRRVCAGRVGFRSPPHLGADPLWCKLVQRAWGPDDRATGNGGGHFGNYEAAFLQRNVLPLFHVHE